MCVIYNRQIDLNVADQIFLESFYILMSDVQYSPFHETSEKLKHFPII